MIIIITNTMIIVTNMTVVTLMMTILMMIIKERVWEILAEGQRWFEHSFSWLPRPTHQEAQYNWWNHHLKNEING